MINRRLTFLFALLALGWLGTPAGANAPVPLCDGLPATVDGTLGTDGDDVIIGTPGEDTIYAGSGDDVICGGGGADTIFGEDGRDRIFGENGEDTVNGGPGPDFIDGGAAADLILGGGGNDRIKGGNGHDEIGGGNGQDVIRGMAGDDVILGGSGMDRLRGGAGQDQIMGQRDIDRIIGGANTDLCQDDTTTVRSCEIDFTIDCAVTPFWDGVSVAWGGLDHGTSVEARHHDNPVGTVHWETAWFEARTSDRNGWTIAPKLPDVDEPVEIPCGPRLRLPLAPGRGVGLSCVSTLR